MIARNLTKDEEGYLDSIIYSNCCYKQNNGYGLETFLNSEKNVAYR